MDQDLLYECVECNDKTIVLAGDIRKDGRTCTVCGAYTTPIGFVGVDLAKGNDFTLYHPPGVKTII